MDSGLYDDVYKTDDKATTGEDDFGFDIYGDIPYQQHEPERQESYDSYSESFEVHQNVKQESGSHPQEWNAGPIAQQPQSKQQTSSRRDRETTPERGSSSSRGTSDTTRQRTSTSDLSQSERDRDGPGGVFLAIGNLTWWTTDQQVEDMCGAWGRVKSVKFCEDRLNGKSKGLVWVEFATAEGAKRALERLQGFTVNGRMVTVEPCDPRNVPGFYLGSFKGPHSSDGGSGGGVGPQRPRDSKPHVHSRPYQRPGMGGGSGMPGMPWQQQQAMGGGAGRGRGFSQGDFAQAQMAMGGGRFPQQGFPQQGAEMYMQQQSSGSGRR